MPSELNQTIEDLQAALAISINTIAELEKAKADAERAVRQTEQAKLDAENAKQEVDRRRIAERMTSDALFAQLRADKVAAGAKNSRWEMALYGSVGGLLVVLTASAIGFFVNRHKASVSKEQVWELENRSKPRRNVREKIEPYALSPEIAVFEAAFERELDEQVATIDAAQDGRLCSSRCVRGQLGAVYRFAWDAIELPSDPDAGDRRVGETFARDTQAAPESATSGNSAALMISSASWTKRILASAMPWADRAFGAIVVKIPTPAAPCPGA